MLRFHFQNVGHGEAMVLEYESVAGERAYGVVDSNSKAGQVPPALLKLRSLGASSLDFIAFTHPHADHFSGLNAIMEEFDGRISNFYSFPVDRERGRLKAWAQEYADAVAGSDSETVLNVVKELVSIFVRAASIPTWEECSGIGQLLNAPGMPGVGIRVILPPSDVKGDFFGAIDRGQSVLRAEKNNDLSLALEVTYRGKTVLLGGDGTLRNWTYVRQRYPSALTEDFGSLGADVAKIPHHGSQKDAGKLPLDFIFGPTAKHPQQIAIVSADGKKHPHPDVIKDLAARDVLPYCTNLAAICSSGEIRDVISTSSLDAALVRFLNTVSSDTARSSPCQGDITVEIDNSGQVSVLRQYQNLCPFRGEFPTL